MEGIVWFEESTKAMACFFGLILAVLSELYSMVGDCLVNIAVFWWLVSNIFFR